MHEFSNEGILQNSRRNLFEQNRINQINPRTNCARIEDFDYYQRISSKLNNDNYLQHAILKNRINCHKDLLRIENNLEILNKKSKQAWNDKIEFLTENPNYFIIPFIENHKRYRINLTEGIITDNVNIKDKICFYALASPENSIVETNYIDRTKYSINYSEKLLNLYDLHYSYQNRYEYLFNVFKILIENMIYNNYFLKLFPKFEKMDSKKFAEFIYHDLITIVLNDRKYVIESKILTIGREQKRITNWFSEKQKLPIIKIDNEEIKIIESMKV